jgi:hypothetical protein
MEPKTEKTEKTEKKKKTSSCHVITQPSKTELSWFFFFFFFFWKKDKLGYKKVFSASKSIFFQSKRSCANDKDKKGNKKWISEKHENWLIPERQVVLIKAGWKRAKW